MNSRIEPRFRDTGDARGKLVGLTSGVGFRLLVKQALAPGEPLQIDIGDGNLLVLARYRLPVEAGHSFGSEIRDRRQAIVEGIDDWRRGDDGQDAAGMAARLQIQEDRGAPPAALALDSPSIKSSVKDRRGLVLGGIAAAIILSALGIVWGGSRAERGIASLPAFAEPAKTLATTAPTKRTVESAATAIPGAPRPVGFVGPTAPSVKPATASKAIPFAAVARVNSAPVEIASAQPATVSKVMVDSGAGPVRSISIKASDVAWVTACADGVKVFGKVFNKGDNAEVRFSSRAEVHSANAGAIELTMGSQSIGLMGRWGQVRTINATPTSYEFVVALPGRNCADTTPAN